MISSTFIIASESDTSSVKQNAIVTIYFVKFTKQISMLKKFPFYLVATIAAILLLSSFKLSKNEYDEAPTALDSLTVTQAKDLFKKTIDPRFVSSPLSSVYNLKNYTPLWEKATTNEDNEELIVETPLNFLKVPATVISASGVKQKPTDVNQKTELLIVRKKKNQYLSFALMHIVPNLGSNTNINYKTNDSSFSGYIFFTNLNGRLINSWQYQKGVAIREGYLAAAPTNSYSANNKGAKCSIIHTNWYETKYTELNSDLFNATAWNYVNSYVITYCTPTNITKGALGKNEWTAFPNY